MRFANIIAILALLIISLPVSILNAEGISITPPRSIINTLPGQSLDISYNISNNTSAPKTFELESAQIIDNTILTTTENTDLEWIKLKPETITINPSAKQQVSFSILVDQEAKEGVYRFLIIAKETNSSNLNETGTGVNMALGYTLEVNVLNSLLRTNLETNLFVTPNISLQNKFEVQLAIKNKSNINIYPIGYLKIFSPKGDVVFQEVINDRQVQLVANSELNSTYSFSIEAFSPLDSFGRYTAEFIALEPALGLSSKSIQTFLNIHWAISAAIFIILLLAVYLLKRVINALLRKKLPSNQI